MARELDLTECPECGLLQRYPHGSDGTFILCPRCNAVLGQFRSLTVPISLICAVLGLILLGFALVQPAASLTLQGGRFAVTDLFQGIELLEESGTWELAAAVGLTLFAFPFLNLSSVAIMCVYALRGHAPRWAKSFFSIMRGLRGWAMVDVFLLGAMIALFRMRSWGYVWFGPALFALGGVALCTLCIEIALDTRTFWKRVGGRVLSTAKNSIKNLPFIGCHHCGAVLRSQAGSRCPRCEQTLERRKPHSIKRTWAFVIAALVLLVPANVLPVMTVTKMGRGGADTILSGTIELSQHGLWGLAAIVFIASIVVPILKIATLVVLLITTGRRSAMSLRARTKSYRIVAVIGRWSMIDIFATMTLVAVARFGWLGNVLPGTGASAFCAVVFLTMIAAESFDPRLMWDAAGRNRLRPAGQPQTSEL